ncbi:opacity family porin [Neisseria polysaccharea]|uniref:opacity family porin n=1 Tax=Neisseria polysaccharea TaxID=489 RepID=UPI00272D9306|nr:opacity family porin [Neisseria polysaccharea]
MKKLLTALTVLALPAAVFAADNQPGVYVQGDVGAVFVSVNDEIKTKPIPHIAVGYDTGDVRIAADYQRIRFKELGDTYALQGAGVTVIKDFNTNSIVKPYVGARLGLNRISLKSNSEKYSKTKAGFSALGGVGFEITPNVNLDLGYRFNYLGGNEAFNTQYSELTAGVRVKF